MIAVIAAVLLGLAALLAWRHARLAAHPETWPAGLSFARLLRLTKAYLKQDGWKLLEPTPAWRLFIRGQKDRVGVSLMIQTSETLSLPTLMKDAVNITAPTGLIVGILSQETLLPEFQAEADRHGIYIVAPADLPGIANLIRRATLRRNQIKEAGLPAADGATHQSALTRSLSA